MAAGDIPWNNLPSVILFELFTYLPHKDRIRASSTCKQWRSALYHPRFWRNVHIKLKSCDSENKLKTQYFTSCFTSMLQNITVTFNSVDPYCVEELANVLESLIGNFNLRNISLVPSHCSFECPTIDGTSDKEYFKRWILKPLLDIAQNSYNLKGIQLGCLEELTACSNIILEEFSQYHGSSIRSLGLASVKYDPDDYVLIEIDASLFSSLCNLQILSLDFDYLNDELLTLLSRLGSLQRLIVHVHGIFDGHPGTSNESWDSFSRQNPKCEVRVNLIHSYDGVEMLQSLILKPSMPLTHLRVFFCEQLNELAINNLSTFANTLQSIWWVDSINATNSMLVDPHHFNPFVMCSWRCKKLQEIVLYGYQVYADDVCGISKLRGKSINRLEFAASDLIVSYDHSIEKIEKEVSEALGYSWKAVSDEELHSVIRNPNVGDSDEFILPIVLQDLSY